MIQYEYPFNERIRTYLRLEDLFDKLSLLIRRQDAIDHHFALSCLFEILEVASRSELKGEVLRDLERQKLLLQGYRGNPAISEQALEQVVSQLDQHIAALNEMTGKIGPALPEQEVLTSQRSRFGIPGGSSAFDLPGYHA
ncbi:MAG: cell division protein ZapD, partial [Limnohabitans sp.]